MTDINTAPLLRRRPMRRSLTEQAAPPAPTDEPTPAPAVLDLRDAQRRMVEEFSNNELRLRRRPAAPDPVTPDNELELSFPLTLPHDWPPRLGAPAGGPSWAARPPDDGAEPRLGGEFEEVETPGYESSRFVTARAEVTDRYGRPRPATPLRGAVRSVTLPPDAQRTPQALVEALIAAHPENQRAAARALSANYDWSGATPDFFAQHRYPQTGRYELPVNFGPEWDEALAAYQTGGLKAAQAVIQSAYERRQNEFAKETAQQQGLQKERAEMERQSGQLTEPFQTLLGEKYGAAVQRGATDAEAGLRRLFGNTAGLAGALVGHVAPAGGLSLERYGEWERAGAEGLARGGESLSRARGADDLPGQIASGVTSGLLQAPVALPAMLSPTSAALYGLVERADRPADEAFAHAFTSMAQQRALGALQGLTKSAAANRALMGAADLATGAAGAAVGELQAGRPVDWRKAVAGGVANLLVGQALGGGEKRRPLAEAVRLLDETPPTALAEEITLSLPRAQAAGALDLAQAFAIDPQVKPLVDQRVRRQFGGSAEELARQLSHLEEQAAPLRELVARAEQQAVRAEKMRSQGQVPAGEKLLAEGAQAREQLTALEAQQRALTAHLAQARGYEGALYTSLSLGAMRAQRLGPFQRLAEGGVLGTRFRNPDAGPTSPGVRPAVAGLPGAELARFSAVAAETEPGFAPLSASDDGLLLTIEQAVRLAERLRATGAADETAEGALRTLETALTAAQRHGGETVALVRTDGQRPPAEIVRAITHENVHAAQQEAAGDGALYDLDAFGADVGPETLRKLVNGLRERGYPLASEAELQREILTNLLDPEFAHEAGLSRAEHEQAVLAQARALERQRAGSAGVIGQRLPSAVREFWQTAEAQETPAVTAAAAAPPPPLAARRTRADVLRAPEFKQFFGDWEAEPDKASKVVDEAGQPLIVYHGTPADFDVFRYSMDAGFHFGTPKAAADILQGRARDVQDSSVFQEQYVLPELTKRLRAASFAVPTGSLREIRRYLNRLTPDETARAERISAQVWRDAEQQARADGNAFVDQAQIMPVYLNIRNPLVMDDITQGNIFQGRQDYWAELHKRGILTDKDRQQLDNLNLFSDEGP